MSLQATVNNLLQYGRLDQVYKTGSSEIAAPLLGGSQPLATLVLVLIGAFANSNRSLCVAHRGAPQPGPASEILCAGAGGAGAGGVGRHLHV